MSITQIEKGDRQKGETDGRMKGNTKEKKNGRTDRKEGDVRRE